MKFDLSLERAVSPLPLALLLCLGTGGASGAPAEAPIAVGQPDAAQSSEAIGEAEPEADRALADVGQFDLECTSVVRDVTESRGGPGETPYARPYIFNPRFFVDLAARKYCDPMWCETSGVWRIHAIDADTIAFLDVHLPGFVSVHTVDRRNGRYMRRVRDERTEWLTEGTCRQVPFSGFPDTSNAILSDPWNSNGERIGSEDLAKLPAEPIAQTQ